MPACEQPPRSAFNGNSFPSTVGVFARSGSIFKGKANVVGNEEVKISIAVIIHEGAARAKPLLIAPKPGGFCYIGESSVSVIAVKHVLPEIGAKDVVKAIVVVISDADSAGPSERPQLCFFRDTRKGPIPIVLIQPIRRALRSASETCAA